MRSFLTFSPLWMSLVCLVLLSHSAPGAAEKDDDDKFEGAVWKFTLKAKSSKDKSDEVRHGAIRVNGGKLYQRERDGDDEKFSKLVGTKEVLGKSRTRLTFTDLSLDKGKITGVKGKAEIHGEAAGEWSGVFVDSDGKNWTAKFTRFQE